MTREKRKSGSRSAMVTEPKREDVVMDEEAMVKT